MIKSFIMNLVTKKCLLTPVFLFLTFQLFSQNNPNDYWLENGFFDGDTVYVNSGFFYDDGGYELYNTGQDWTVIFCSENGNPITLDFNGFRTHYEGSTTGDYDNWDYMTIDYTGTKKLAAYSTDTPQFSFTSPDGCISLGFVSQEDSQPDSGWVAEISTNPPPPNNDQCSATELIVGNVCSPSFYSNKGAWDTRGLDSPSCHEKFFGGDVWFTAIVPDSGQLKVETLPGSLTYGIMVLYRGTCDNLTEYECVSVQGTMPSRTFTGLNPGERVYIRIFGDQAQSGTFGICATDPTAQITGFTGPGGVGDAISNRLWLKADTGVVDINLESVSNGNKVSFWLDKSGNENHLKQPSGPNQPLFNRNGLNGGPSLMFDGNSTFMTDTLGIFAAPVNIFSVHNFSVSKDHTLLALGDANESNTLSIGREDISNNYYTYVNTKQYGQELPVDAQILFAKYGVISPYHGYALNGTPQTVNYTEGQVSTNGSLYIGANKDLNTYLEGNISEIIFYSKVLNEAQEIIVNNYLAAKYTISIQNNFYGFRNSHPHELAGIGRVDEKNSHSKAQSGGILSLGGASELGDDEFVLFAHDGGDVTSWSSSEVPSQDPDVLRLEREWKVDIKGDGPGLLTIGLDTTNLPVLPMDYSAYNILVDDDGDFSSGAEFYGLIPAGDELIANNVSLPDEAYIGIAAVKARVNFSKASSSGLESEERPVIEVELNYAVSEPFTVEYEVSSGTAVNGEDYSLASSILTFEAGEKLKEIRPLIFEDTIVEIPDEYFVIHLANPGSVVLSGDTMDHTYTIVDNDLSLFVTASDSIIGECETSMTTLKAHAAGPSPLSFSWSPAEGLEDPSSAVTVANPSATTTYVVEVRDSLGGSKKDSLQIVVEPLPAQAIITANGETEFCDGGSVQISAPEGYAYLWNNGSTARTLDIDTSGTFTVRVIDEFGCESLPADSLEVVVYPVPGKPEITVMGDLFLCEGETVELSAPEGYAYQWSNGAESRSIVVSESGEYSVRVLNSETCISVPSDTIEVVVSSLPPEPVISHAGDNEICQGESITLTGNEGYEYLWSNGETSRSITVSEEGIYSLQLINGACISTPESIEIIVHPVPEKPQITATGDPFLCEGETVELSAPEGYAYQWSNGAESRSIVVSESGEYSVRVLNSETCISVPSDTIEVVVSSLPPEPVISHAGDNEICQGESITLTGNEGYEYLWSNGETSRSITVSEEGIYSLQLINGACISTPESIEIIVHPVPEKPSITPEGPVNIIKGESVILRSSEADQYLWSTSETSREIEVAEEGEYSVQVISNAGCESEISDPVEVSVTEILPAPEISIEGETSFCEGGSVSLISEEAHAYRWSNGDTTRELMVRESGAYSLFIVNANGVESFESDPVVVEVFENPSAESDITDVSCFSGSDGSINLTIVGGELPYSVDWSTGSEGTSVNGLAAGIYNVTITDANGCTIEKEANVQEPEEIVIEGEIIDARCPDAADGEIALDVSGGISPYLYTWDEGMTGPVLRNLSAGVYTVTISDANNCKKSESFAIKNREEYCFRIPDIITPNGDGKNDTWLIDGLDIYPEATVQIFDRWGKRVFYSEGYDGDFDGTYNGEDLPMESYHYIIDLKDGTPVIIGNITIVR